jgi:hypothetical protein
MVRLDKIMMHDRQISQINYRVARAGSPSYTVRITVLPELGATETRALGWGCVARVVPSPLGAHPGEPPPPRE